PRGADPPLLTVCSNPRGGLPPRLPSRCDTRPVEGRFTLTSGGPRHESGTTVDHFPSRAAGAGVRRPRLPVHLARGPGRLDPVPHPVVRDPHRPPGVLESPPP